MFTLSFFNNITVTLLFHAGFHFHIPGVRVQAFYSAIFEIN